MLAWEKLCLPGSRLLYHRFAESISCRVQKCGTLQKPGRCRDGHRATLPRTTACSRRSRKGCATWPSASMSWTTRQPNLSSSEPSLLSQLLLTVVCHAVMLP